MPRARWDDLTFLNQAAALWGQDENHDIGYLARVFAQTALPYRDPGAVPVWLRRNGGLALNMQPGYDVAGQPIGYPYGSVPRLLLTWLSTEAVRTKERTLALGESLNDFTRQLGMGSTTGGRNGSITRLRSQIIRLFNARISVLYSESYGELHREAARHFVVVNAYELWWSTTARQANQPALWPSSVELSQEFFDEVTTRPVPLNLSALRLLGGSPLRLDLYAFLTYRMSYLRRPTTVPWDALLFQFGSSANTKQARRKFRLDFTAHLARVLTVYPEARVSVDAKGLTMRPSPPHVSRGLRAAIKP